MSQRERDKNRVREIQSEKDYRERDRMKKGKLDRDRVKGQKSERWTK